MWYKLHTPYTRTNQTICLISQLNARQSNVLLCRIRDSWSNRMICYICMYPSTKRWNRFCNVNNAQDQHIITPKWWRAEIDKAAHVVCKESPIQQTEYFSLFLYRADSNDLIRKLHPKTAQRAVHIQLKYTNVIAFTSFSSFPVRHMFSNLWNFVWHIGSWRFEFIQWSVCYVFNIKWNRNFCWQNVLRLNDALTPILSLNNKYT